MVKWCGKLLWYKKNETYLQVGNSNSAHHTTPSLIIFLQKVFCLCHFMSCVLYFYITKLHVGAMALFIQTHSQSQPYHLNFLRCNIR